MYMQYNIDHRNPGALVFLVTTDPPGYIDVTRRMHHANELAAIGIGMKEGYIRAHNRGL